MVDTTPPTKTAAVAKVEVGSAPQNLPTAVAVPDYLSIEVEPLSDEWEMADNFKILEDRAHRQYTLLSSDAMRYFYQVFPDSVNHLEQLDQIIAKAKAEYTSEDGWLVINLSRLQEILGSFSPLVVDWNNEFSDESSEPTGSLAEAILAGNTKAALSLIENRPMVALANATAELDAAYRFKHGEAVDNLPLSEMLAKQTASFSVGELEAVIKALTSAIDGTYADEEAAVKTALLKAVAVVAK